VPAAIGLVVLVLLAGCTSAIRVYQAQQGPGHCGSDARDGISGSTWTGEWSWAHFGAECVIHYNDGRDRTVYFR
jgi:hypothetical protein